MCKEFFGLCECVQYNIGVGNITTYLYWQVSYFSVLNSTKNHIKFFFHSVSFGRIMQSYWYFFIWYERMTKSYFIFLCIFGVDSVDQSRRFYKDLLQVSLRSLWSLNFPSTWTILMPENDLHFRWSALLVQLLFRNQLARISTTVSLLAP